MAEKTKKTTDQSSKKTFYVIAALIPLVFIIILEMILRLTGYGIDTEQWKVMGEKYIINPDIAYKYFNNLENIPTTIEDVFDIDKKENAFRIFVLGGSSAAGFPYEPMGSFSRYIRLKLEQAYHEKKIEVVNLSMSAVNTYTILDLLPGVIEQKPDLILIYAGHNEYYGALGVGSMESLGQSRSIVKLMLYLNEFKTVQLVRNLLKSLFGSISAEGEQRSGTMMSQMVSEKQILLNSGKYKAGLEQFKDNLDEIAEKCKVAKVPIMLGRLVSNIKDQPPFISVKTGKLPAAGEVFKEAKSDYSKGMFRSADSLFKLAKDLDGLRFRAPEKINQIIEQTAAKYDLPVAAVDSAFIVAAINGIVGKELMTDHLHPNLKGFSLMGQCFYDKIIESGYLSEKPSDTTPSFDQAIISGFIISDLDTMIGDYRIISLKNDWPFTAPEFKKPLGKIIRPANMIDTLAFEVVGGKIKWLDAHLQAAKKYLRKNDIQNFVKHYRVIIYEYPSIYEFRDDVINILLQNNDYDTAEKFLKDYYKENRNAFNSKWLGNILLFRKNYSRAIMYLEKSLKLNGKDPQVLYNLAGAYAFTNRYSEGINLLDKCLVLQKDYPGALQLKTQLQRLIKK